MAGMVKDGCKGKDSLEWAIVECAHRGDDARAYRLLAHMCQLDYRRGIRDGGQKMLDWYERKELEMQAEVHKRVVELGQPRLSAETLRLALDILRFANYPVAAPTHLNERIDMAISEIEAVLLARSGEGEP